MDPSTKRIRPAQIVALALIALLTVGLLYVRFSPDDTLLIVPAGAQAGDLVMEPCTYSTGDGELAAECGTLVVPENRADPGSRLIALPVTRIRARSADPGEPIFYLQGGPGVPNDFDDPAIAGRFTDSRDVVLVGYRGVQGSSVLACPEMARALKASTDLIGEGSLQRYGEAFTSCARRLGDEGVHLDGYTLTARVEDMEAVRVALGYDRVDLLSESAGTRTAMIYAWRHPESIHRSVMIGVNPPGHYLWDPEETDTQLGYYSDLCAEDASCSGRADDLTAAMRNLAADMPDRWLFLPINQGNVRVGSFYGLMETTPAAGLLSGPMVLDSWLSAAG
jgi:pimeloyl-ACP methyl ester carboxylesterase